MNQIRTILDKQGPYPFSLENGLMINLRNILRKAPPKLDSVDFIVSSFSEAKSKRLSCSKKYKIQRKVSFFNFST